MGKQGRKFSATNNEMIMVAGEKTDMFRDPNVTYNTDNAPKLLFRPDNDFVLTASIEHSFSSKWDGGGHCAQAGQPELDQIVLKRLYRR